MPENHNRPVHQVKTVTDIPEITHDRVGCRHVEAGGLSCMDHQGSANRWHKRTHTRKERIFGKPENSIENQSKTGKIQAVRQQPALRQRRQPAEHGADRKFVDAEGSQEKCGRRMGLHSPQAQHEAGKADKANDAGGKP